VPFQHKSFHAKPNSTQPPQIFDFGISRSPVLSSRRTTPRRDQVGQKSHGRVQCCIIDSPLYDFFEAYSRCADFVESTRLRRTASTRVEMDISEGLRRMTRLNALGLSHGPPDPFMDTAAQASPTPPRP
jgi:hypothetical protein